MDPKLAKRVDTLYRNCKQMPLLCILALFVPLVLPFVVPLCLVYASQRTALLKQLNGVDLATTVGDENDAEVVASQVRFIRANGNRFYLPVVIAAGVAVLIAVIVLFG